LSAGDRIGADGGIGTDTKIPVSRIPVNRIPVNRPDLFVRDKIRKVILMEVGIRNLQGVE
jgi:hypothetical protein